MDRRRGSSVNRPLERSECQLLISSRVPPTMSQLVLAAMLRRSISSFVPWSVVLALELANEWADIRFSNWPSVDARYGASILDVAVTIALPTVLLIVSRRYPHILTQGGRRKVDA